MIDLIRAFAAKLQVFRNFPNLKKYMNDLDIHKKTDKERVTEEFISLIDYLIKEFSARFTQFKELSEIIKFIMYPDETSFNKLNLSQFDWLETKNLKCRNEH
ncbi:unnamed protein product [Acanthoscelides obtectus]|uniref:Uncharacterized protein n=1 Tax=Acanthoscelides obtectus TaxID=200917 RepID=A0A9P0P8N7_ACAOB|nr:unnamed protein product [Acanthoscelides obtectus]CAK1625597.1 hypothetical protein AOBTE_LOCUS3258 [Acanthoscelides obtectus]